MKKYRFLLLDTGPILKLFELDIWEKFIKQCEVTITRTVAQECIYYETDGIKNYINFPFEQVAEQGHIKIVDVNPSQVRDFMKKWNSPPRYDIHEGELETLTFFVNSSEDFLVCASDHVVFRFLGYIGKAERGISLDEILKDIGLNKQLGRMYKKEFRIKNTSRGQIDFLQNKKN